MGKWLLIGAVGLAAVFILPKFLGGASASSGGGGGSGGKAMKHAVKQHIKGKKNKHQPAAAAKLAQSWYYPLDDLRLTVG